MYKIVKFWKNKTFISCQKYILTLYRLLDKDKKKYLILFCCLLQLRDFYIFKDKSVYCIIYCLYNKGLKI